MENQGLWIGMIVGESLTICYYTYIIRFKYSWDTIADELKLQLEKKREFIKE